MAKKEEERLEKEKNENPHAEKMIQESLLSEEPEREWIDIYHYQWMGKG